MTANYTINNFLLDIAFILCSNVSVGDETIENMTQSLHRFETFFRVDSLCEMFHEFKKNIYCSSSLEKFQEYIRSPFGFISLFLCIFGITSNIANIIILTRKEMRSPTNTILTGLAVADLCVMIDYIPYTLHEYILYKRSELNKHTYNWCLFVIFHANFAQCCHTISIWLTVVLALWRYCYVEMALKRFSLFKQKKALSIVLLIYLISFIFCFPLFLSSHIDVLDDHEGNKGYVVSGMSQDSVLKLINFWVYGVCIKLVPCAILSVAIILIFTVLCHPRRSQRLRSSLPKHKKTVFIPCAKNEITTTLLIIILLLFLLCEVPQGILSCLSAYYDAEFYFQCVKPLDEVMDFLALLNSAIDFLLYCSMSSAFRKTFQKTCKSILFFPSVKKEGIEERETKSIMVTSV